MQQAPAGAQMLGPEFLLCRAKLQGSSSAMSWSQGLLLKTADLVTCLLHTPGIHTDKHIHTHQTLHDKYLGRHFLQHVALVVNPHL